MLENTMNIADKPHSSLRILGFLCNWCSYGGADTAGVCRFRQPPYLRIIRIPCTGRMDPLFVIKALAQGADGVLVSGCHPKDCHYAVGNFYARRRLELVQRYLPFIGIDPRRFRYTWVSASEGQRWQQVVTEFSAIIEELGPNPGFGALPHQTRDSMTAPGCNLANAGMCQLAVPLNSTATR